MSLLKNWKLILATMSVALFTACGGTSGGSDDSGSYGDDGYSESSSNGGSGKSAAAKKKEPPKEVIDQAKVDKSHKEASAITEENHKLRIQIFELKNELGIIDDVEESAEEAPAEEDAQ